MTGTALLRCLLRGTLGSILALGLAASAPALAQSHDTLGRLFFTPEKRQLLDRQRDLNVQAQQETPEDPTLTINGVVSRSSGKRTVWVNGAAQNEKDIPSDVVVTPEKKNPARVVVQPSQQSATQARVGDTINRSSGETMDVIGGGTIAVGKPGRPISK